MPQIILVEKSTVVPATPARLYKSLTDAKELARWLADRVESDPRQGGQIVIDYDSHEKRGEYRRLIPGIEVGIRRFVDWYLAYYRDGGPQDPKVVNLG